jgi:dihydrodipicolinate synthase/N-acetylneuraminate lyase
VNRAFVVVALAAVTFAQGFLGALIASGLTGLDASAVQAAAVGAAGAAMSVLVNGLGKLHAHLADKVTG